MTQARSTLVSLSDTPYYHCVSRCVRRAFLCGDDHYSGRNYAHRRTWVVERLSELSAAFAIDVCSYAIMSNHYHLVIRIDAPRAQSWSIDDVIERWTRLFKGPQVIARYVRETTLTEHERHEVNRIVATWRERLADISWYMRCLNEHIARRANTEDQCRGRFWEGRFKCQALLDDTAVVTAMTYVDLNPIRAGLATDLPASEHTSVQQRIAEIAEPTRPPPIPLLPFQAAERHDPSRGLPFNQQDYLDLADWSARCVREDNRRAIPAATPSLLDALGIDPTEWLATVTEMQARYERVMGSPSRMRRLARSRGGKFFRGYRYAERLYRRASTAM